MGQVLSLRVRRLCAHARMRTQPLPSAVLHALAELRALRGRQGRTGLAVACYRMAVEHWPLRKALDEAKKLGLSLSNQIAFLQKFSAALLADAARPSAEPTFRRPRAEPSVLKLSLRQLCGRRAARAGAAAARQARYALPLRS